MKRSYHAQARILIVDDEQTNLKLVDKILRGQGYQNLVLVHDPRQVLVQYQTGRPDLILLDINMPHLDGYQVLEKLKALDDPMLPPIIILTAQHGKGYLLRALTAGARDFVTKPFDRSELLMRVHNLLDVQLAHVLLHDQNTVLERLVRERTSELHDTRLQVVRRLSNAMEYRDTETGNHILRMSHICAVLARGIGWSEAQCDLILNASPMHDIGKIGIPDAILLKAGRLDSDEWEIMKSHTTIGAALLQGDASDLMRMAREIALSHHEKWDGSGYPAGLSGEAIPLSGRIAALADVFDALSSTRPYKKGWPMDSVLKMISDNSGAHFDPELVQVLIDTLPEIMAIREQFAEM